MTQAEIDHAEESLGFKLPATYAKFMIANGERLAETPNAFNGALALDVGDLTMTDMLARAAADSAVGDMPSWWDDYFAIGDDGGGGYFLMKRDGSPEVWLMDSDWQVEPSVHSPSLQAFVDQCRKRA